MYNVATRKVKVSALGVNQAMGLLQKLGDDKETIKKVVAIAQAFGIPVVVREQVNALVAQAKAVIAGAQAAVAQLRAKDDADAKQTQAKVDKITVARKARAQQNAAARTAESALVGPQDDIIRGLQELAEKFGQ